MPPAEQVMLWWALLNRAPMSHCAEHSGLMCFLLNRTIHRALRRRRQQHSQRRRRQKQNGYNGTNNTCSAHRKPSRQQCACINVPFFRFVGTGIMGRWNGDTEKQHTNKRQHRCAAATCTHLQKPHQNHPFSQIRAARLKVEREKGTE